jgi:hypothetical protein
VTGIYNNDLPSESPIADHGLDQLNRDTIRVRPHFRPHRPRESQREDGSRRFDRGDRADYRGRFEHEVFGETTEGFGKPYFEDVRCWFRNRGWFGGAARNLEQGYGFTILGDLEIEGRGRFVRETRGISNAATKSGPVGGR